MSKLNAFLIFSLGAAVGSVVTWKLVKDKYEKMAAEEIDAMKETVDHELDELREKKEENLSEENVFVKEHNRIMRENGYITYSENGEEKEEKEEAHMDENKPYVISPDEYDERYGYTTRSLTYYSDGVLADEYDEIIEDVDGIVGTDSLNHFGEYEEDSVFVRNDDLKTDFEILRDYRTYTEVVGEDE